MDSLWIALSLVSAFSLATSDALTKKALSQHNEYLVAWLRIALSLPILLASLMFVPIPRLDADFFVASLLALPLEIIAMILYVKALKFSPLSLTLPFLALTPVFLIVIPHLVLGESVSLPGAAGVVLIALGGYCLNVREFGKGFFKPLVAIKREKGAVYMIGVALIYAVTSTLGKKAIAHSSPLFFGACYFAVLSLLFTPIALFSRESEVKRVSLSGALRALFLPGVLYAVMIVSHMVAISLTNVAYMVSVKRLSLVIGVVYGHFFFNESGMRERLIGTSLMLAGFIFIVLYH